MHMNNKLNKRDAVALDVLKAGGYFKKALERRGYRGGLKFQTRLYDAQNNRVSGCGSATLKALSAFLGGSLAYSIGCAGTVERWALVIPTDAAGAVAHDQREQ